MTISYTCPHCEHTSFNPNDADHRYCGFCHQFEDDIMTFVPAHVAPLPDALVMDGTSRKTLFTLADRLQGTPLDRTPTLLAGVWSLDLMRNRMLGWTHSMVMRRRKLDAYDAWLAIFSHRPKRSRKLFKAITDHMFKGKDAYDPRSVGGFCTAELQQIANVVAIVNRRDPLVAA